jgi:hypothetical protein
LALLDPWALRKQNDAGQHAYSPRFFFGQASAGSIGSTASAQFDAAFAALHDLTGLMPSAPDQRRTPGNSPEPC